MTPSEAPPARAPRAVFDLVLYALSQVAQGLIALGIVGGIAHALGPVGFGEFSFSFVLATLASLIADFGLGPWVTRAVAQTPAERGGVQRIVFWLRGRLLLLAVLVLGVASLAFASAPGRVLGLSLLFLYTVLLGYAGILEGVLMGLRRVGRVVTSTLIGRALELVGVLVAAALGQLDSVTGAALALLPGAAVRLLMLFAWSRVAEPADAPAGAPAGTRFGTRGQVLREVLPFAAAAALWMAYFKVDVLLLERLGTAAGLGLYTAAARLVEALLLVPRSVAAVLYAILSAAWVQGRVDAELLSRPLRPLLAVGFGMAGGLWVMPAEAMHFLFGAGFAPGHDALRILALALVPVFLNQYFGMIFTTTHRQGEWTWYLAIGLVLNVALNLVLLPRIGYTGAAWAKLASELGLSLVFLFVLTKRFGSLVQPLWALRLVLATAGMMAFVSWLPAPFLVRMAAGGLVFCGLAALLGVVTAAEWNSARRSFLEGLSGVMPRA